MNDWTAVCKQDELKPGAFQVVDVDDVAIAVFNVDGQLFAVEDICTHDGSPLTGGGVDAHQVICPRHGARFCLRSGRALTPPAYEPIAVFPVRIENDTIYVRDDRWD